MATKDVTDVQVIEAILQAQKDWRWDACEVLMFRTKQCEKVCMAALERAYGRGLIECGVRLARGWVTPKGHALLESEIPREGA